MLDIIIVSTNYQRIMFFGGFLVKRFIIILITLIMMTFSLIYAAEQPFVLPVNMGSDVIHNPAGRGFYMRVA